MRNGERGRSGPGSPTKITRSLTSRTDARSITATLTYDAVNRLTEKSYSDSARSNPTPWVSYSYQPGTDLLSSVSSSGDLQLLELRRSGEARLGNGGGDRTGDVGVPVGGVDAAGAGEIPDLSFGAGGDDEF